MPAVISAFLILPLLGYYVALYMTEPNHQPQRYHMMFYSGLLIGVIGLGNTITFAVVFYQYINR